LDDSLLSNSQLERFFEFLTGASTAVRLFGFFLIWMLLWLPLAIPLGVALQWRPWHRVTTPAQKLPLVASLYALAPVVIWGEAILEQGSLRDYGLWLNVASLQSLGSGLVLGVSGLAILFTLQQQLGWIRLQPQPAVLPIVSTESSVATELDGLIDKQSLSSRRLALLLFSTLAIALWISFIEELVFRGFLVNQLQRDAASWIAVTIASLIFALLHLVWEGQEAIPQLLGLWLMGVVLSIACWADQGSLGLAIGLHAGWVWTIASLDTTQLICYTGKAPEWLTGLGNKPLAGVMGLLSLVVTAGVLIGIRS
jgi:membrane protease YdiL (CAAX protease family)